MKRRIVANQCPQIATNAVTHGPQDKRGKYSATPLIVAGTPKRTEVHVEGLCA